MSLEEAKIVSTRKSRIQSSATDDVERRSPFFIRNELICKKFGKFITELGGESLGNYNAWSYKVKGKLVRKHQWIFQIEKATYTGGNLFISSEKQNLHVASRWICIDLKTSYPDFKIRSRRTGDGLRVIFGKKIHKLVNRKGMFIVSDLKEHPIALQIIERIRHLFDSEKVYQIIYENNKLTIDLRTDRIHENIIEELIQVDFEL